MAQTVSPQKIPRLPRNSHTPTSAAARWQAVVNRDASATTFVYCVLTTRIYCRPSCPSRLARRANVQFYDTPSQAEGAGFRPCKRCKPETLQAVVNPQVQLIRKACQTIEEDSATGARSTLLKLADEAGLTPSHFHRVFKKVMGVTPGKYTAQAINKKENLPGWTGQGETIVSSQQRDMNVPNDFWLLEGLDIFGSIGADNVVGWNEFDALIAAEADYTEMQGVHQLLGDLGPDSPDPVVFPDQDGSFVAGLPRSDI